MRSLRVVEVLAGVHELGLLLLELLLDAQHLVVLGEALGAARRARLDLAHAQADGEVADERVLLSNAQRNHNHNQRSIVIINQDMYNILLIA